MSKAKNVHFSSASDIWATPAEVFDALNREFAFTLDPCSDGTNHKIENHFSIFDSALNKDWQQHRVFMNPPYSQIAKWIEKAFHASTNGALVVCLIPSRTDTKWWHDYVMKGEIRFIRGRLKFGDAKHGAPFPSAIVIFHPRANSLAQKPLLAHA